MRLGITILGSGSNANSIVLHTENAGILIDAGFSRKELLSRLISSNISPHIIKALLISHEHSDHVKGARVIADQLDIPTYTTRATAQYLDEIGRIGKKKILFDAGTPFEINGFHIRPFSVPHDALDPVGFVVSCGDCKVGIATDLGHLNRLCKHQLSGSHALILESNHDIEMQRNSDRHLHLKRRILGKHGHLSNDAVLTSFEELLSENCRFLFLLHISTDCNDYKLVRQLALDKLAELNRSDILLSIVEQSRPSPTVWLS